MPTFDFSDPLVSLEWLKLDTTARAVCLVHSTRPSPNYFGHLFFYNCEHIKFNISSFIPLAVGDRDLRLTLFLGPPRVFTPNIILICLAVIAQRSRVGPHAGQTGSNNSLHRMHSM